MMKYLFTLVLSLAVISCGSPEGSLNDGGSRGDSSVETSEGGNIEGDMVETIDSSPVLQIAECIRGNYTGTADFVYTSAWRFFLNKTSSYNLKVAHNGDVASPEVLFALTNIASEGESTVCTLISNPVFSSLDEGAEDITLLSGSLTHFGRAPLETTNYTTGITNIEVLYTESSCEVGSFSLVRTSDNNPKRVDTIEKQETPVESFNELRSTCENLPTQAETEENDSAGIEPPTEEELETYLQGGTL